MSSASEQIDAAAWGIEPVPKDRRTLSAFDLAVLWGDLGIGVLVIVTGALLVPALGFAQAFAAIVIGSIIGVALLALAGVAGADHGVPTMVLFRPVLGIRGSWIPSTLNLVQLIGWTAVELWAMSEIANMISIRLFDVSARGAWLVGISLVCLTLALWGPVGVTRVWMKRFGAWIVGGISLVITGLLLTSGSVSDALSAPGTGGWPTFGSGLDLVIAMPISWLPLVADYNRFARGSRGAFKGTFVGYLIANVWLYTLGVLLVLVGEASASPAGVATGILLIGGGTITGLLMLLGLLFGETDEAFADIYSGSLSIRNVFPKAPHALLVVVVTVISAALAAVFDMVAYESFLFLIGSVFVPLFGILAADYFIARRRRLDVPALYQEKGPYWFRGGIRIGALIPWIVGFAVYHWIAPTGPSWWVELWDGLVGGSLSGRMPWLAASIPSFLVAALLTAAGSRLSSARPVQKEVDA